MRSREHNCNTTMIQSGEQLIGNGAKGLNSFSTYITFPTPYSSPPIVHATMRAEGLFDDTCCITVVNTTTEGFTVNVERVSVEVRNSSWTQDLSLFWFAKPMDEYNGCASVTGVSSNDECVVLDICLGDDMFPRHGSLPHVILTPYSSSVNEVQGYPFAVQIREIYHDRITVVLRRVRPIVDDELEEQRQQQQEQENELLEVNYSLFHASKSNSFETKTGIAYIGNNNFQSDFIKRAVYFPSTFPVPPHVIVTPRSDPHSVSEETTIVNVQNVTSHSFTAIIRRVGDGAWGQNLYLSYCAQVPKEYREALDTSSEYTRMASIFSRPSIPSRMISFDETPSKLSSPLRLSYTSPVYNSPTKSVTNSSAKYAVFSPLRSQAYGSMIGSPRRLFENQSTLISPVQSIVKIRDQNNEVQDEDNSTTIQNIETESVTENGELDNVLSELSIEYQSEGSSSETNMNNSSILEDDQDIKTAITEVSSTEETFEGLLTNNTIELESPKTTSGIDILTKTPNTPIPQPTLTAHSPASSFRGTPLTRDLIFSSPRGSPQSSSTRVQPSPSFNTSVIGRLRGETFGSSQLDIIRSYVDTLTDGVLLTGQRIYDMLRIISLDSNKTIALEYIIQSKKYILEGRDVVRILNLFAMTTRKRDALHLMFLKADVIPTKLDFGTFLQQILAQFPLEAQKLEILELLKDYVSHVQGEEAEAEAEELAVKTIVNMFRLQYNKARAEAVMMERFHLQTSISPQME